MGPSLSVDVFMMQMCVACTDVLQKVRALLGHGDEGPQGKLILILVEYALKEHSSPVCIVPKQRQSREMCVRKV